MAYESPITLFTTEVASKLTEELDATVFKAVWKCFPYVDRDELLKALEYDRGQYEKGYADGRAARDAEIVRCADCALWGDGKCGVWSNLGVTILTAETGFCNFGERRDNGRPD